MKKKKKVGLYKCKTCGQKFKSRVGRGAHFRIHKKPQRPLPLPTIHKKPVIELTHTHQEPPAPKRLADPKDIYEDGYRRGLTEAIRKILEWGYEVHEDVRYVRVRDIVYLAHASEIKIPGDILRRLGDDAHIYYS